MKEALNYPPMSEQLPSRIREYIKDNRLDEACNVLIGTRLSKTGIAHVARLKQLNELVHSGQISYEEASRESAKIRAALLHAADELETNPKVPNPKKPFLWIGGGLGFAALFAALWWWQLSPAKLDCSEAPKYSIFVANFMESAAFADRLYRNLDANFRRHDSVRIGGIGRSINPTHLNKADTLDDVATENCMNKGLIVYGSLKEVEEEKFFDCYIKLIDLDDPEDEIKTENGEVVISNVKTPEQISFTITDRAKKVSDFTTGLLKYYWGERDALTFFIQALQDSLIEEEGDFKSVAQLYLANTLVKAKEFEQALEIYEEIVEEEPNFLEVIWNMGEVQRELGHREFAVQHFANYVALKQSIPNVLTLPEQDLGVLKEFIEEIALSVPEGEFDIVVAPLVEVTSEEIYKTLFSEFMKESLDKEKKEVRLPKPKVESSSETLFIDTQNHSDQYRSTEEANKRITPKTNMTSSILVNPSTLELTGRPSTLRDSLETMIQMNTDCCGRDNIHMKLTLDREG